MSVPIAGHEPLPFGLKHGGVAGLAYIVLLLFLRPEAIPGFTVGETAPATAVSILALYWNWLTADVVLLAVAVVATFPVTVVLTRVYWRVRSQ